MSLIIAEKMRLRHTKKTFTVFFIFFKQQQKAYYNGFNYIFLFPYFAKYNSEVFSSDSISYNFMLLQYGNY